METDARDMDEHAQREGARGEVLTGAGGGVGRGFVDAGIERCGEDAHLQCMQRILIQRKQQNMSIKRGRKKARKTVLQT